MSLRRIKRTSNGSFTRRSRSDFTLTTEWMRNVESGFEDMNYDASRSDIAADLRSIGNKYDKLVLKMFNQRSHLRGDLLLLKKDAKLLRNEMKYLIVKHDNSTAFKKGCSAENHEKERVLKAEVVTKEMGQLELALAELMSKYYFLLQQTNTLKEINSLWHIRSVLKSDFCQLKSIAGDSGIIPTIRDSIIKKNSAEVEKENAALIQKLRWLTKLGHEFREELHELRAAKTALLSGRSYLESEYGRAAIVEPTQENGEKSLDLKSISNDVRQAEVRIIDSLQERVDALDKLSDAFKSIMIKVGFTSVEKMYQSESHTSVVKSEKTEYGSFYQNCNPEIIRGIDPIVQDNLKDDSNDNDNEPEEVQVRYIRQEDIEETDLRCLTREARERYKEGKTNQSFFGNLDRQSGSKILPNSSGNPEHAFSVLKRNSAGYESVTKHEVIESTVHAPSSIENEEYFDAEESFTSAVTVWLRPEACVISKTASEETLTEEINNGVENEETRPCTRIERQFEEDLDQVTEVGSLLSRFISDREDHVSEMRRMRYESCSSDDDVEIEETNDKRSAIGEATDGEDRHERFFMAKNFFEVHADTEDNANANNRIERKSGEEGKNEESVDLRNNNEVITRESVIMNLDAEAKATTQKKEESRPSPVEKRFKGKRIKGRPQSLHFTHFSETIDPKTRVMTPEDKPVFYDPVGVWQNSANASKTTNAAKSVTGTLERNPSRKCRDRPNLAKDSSKTGENINSRYKTLPRGFKTSKKPESSPVSTVVTPRRSSNANEPINAGCSTLPRKLKGSPNGQARSRPVSNIPSPDPFGPTHEDSKRQTTPRNSATRPNSQVNLKRFSSDRRSSLPKYENPGRPPSRNTNNQQSRPVSRTGSMRRQEKDPVVSPRRPSSRNSTSRPESRTDNSRPSSRTGSYRQGNVSIYGTLPRTRKGTKCPASEVKSIGTEAGSRSRNASCSAVPDDSRLDTVPNDVNETSAAQTSLVTPVAPECAVSERLDTRRGPRRGPHQSLEQLTLIAQDEEKYKESLSSKLEKANYTNNVYGTLPQSRKTHDKIMNSTGPAEKCQDLTNTAKKKTKGLNIKMRKPKTSTNDQEQNLKAQISTTDKEKKTRKTISAKAANFMHNAFRFVSSDSKSKPTSSSRYVNNNCSETPVKRRPQSTGNYNEHRKSFIPAPSLS